MMRASNNHWLITHRKFLTSRARSTTPKPLLVRTTESLFRAGSDADGEISLDSLDIARIEDNVVSGTNSQARKS